MTRRDKAILALVCAAEIINCAKAGALKSRIADLETQRDIYASRAQHWIDRAVEDEEVIDSMQLRLDALADGKVELEDAGMFFCTAYCTEQYPHICGEGRGITASGQPIQAGVTVAADQSIFPYGTVLYIEDVGIRIVQDQGRGECREHILMLQLIPTKRAGVERVRRTSSMDFERGINYAELGRGKTENPRKTGRY